VSTRASFGGGAFRGGGLRGGAVPRDLVALLVVVFVTFTLRFFAATSWLPSMLELSDAVWRRGFVWQLGTYAFVGQGAPGLWFLLELLILFWFGRDIRARLGLKGFWQLLAWGIGTAAVVAVVVRVLAVAVSGAAGPAPFVLLQGQRTLVVVLIAAFATLYRHATILLFFVLPVQARWFLWLELVFAFMGFLGSRDLAGFLGIVAAVGVTYNATSVGGLRRVLRELWLRSEQQRLRRRMERRRRQRKIRLVEDDKPDGPDRWVN